MRNSVMLFGQRGEQVTFVQSPESELIHPEVNLFALSA